MCGEKMTYLVGVDIGGTKVAAALLERDGKMIRQVEMSSDPSDKEKMFQQVVKSIEEVLAMSNVSIKDVHGMGVGVAGKVDRANGIAVYQNNLPWENFPLAERLRAYFSIEQVVIDNDVTMAAFAEWQADGGNTDETFVYLTVSTGISCAAIHNGTYMQGAGFSGEIGLLPVLKDEATDVWRRLEQISSGPAIEKAANMTPEAYFEKYTAEDPKAKALLAEVVEALSVGIYTIISLIDPHRIVIGGGVFNHQPHLLELVKEALKKHLIPEQMDALNRLALSRLKGDSGVVGAGIVGRGQVESLAK